VKIGLTVVLVKAVVDEHNLDGFRVVGCMSAEVDSLDGFRVVDCMYAEVDSLGARAGIQVVGSMFVEGDSLAGVVVQQSRLEHGHLGKVKNSALEADAEEPGPFLEDLDCISMNVPKPQNFAECPWLVVAGIRVNEG
jgi:hypothetical protein